MFRKTRVKVTTYDHTAEVQYIEGLSDKVRKHYQDYPDLELAYELDDPKHPTYIARLIQKVDNEEI